MSNAEADNALIIRQMNRIGELEKQKADLLKAVKLIATNGMNEGFKAWAQKVALDAIEKTKDTGPA